MNIFILDKNPITAAQMLCDRHVPKMIVESGQMLSTAHRLLDGIPEKRRSNLVRPFKHTSLLAMNVMTFTMQQFISTILVLHGR